MCEPEPTGVCGTMTQGSGVGRCVCGEEGGVGGEEEGERVCNG